MKGDINLKTLLNTEKFINEKLADKSIESYAIIVGYGDDEWVFMSDDVNMDTYFDAASIGKVFPTTALALKGIDKGLLSLDDTVGKFYPDAPADKQNITIKHLLTHTSGMIRKQFPANVAERGRDSIAEFVLNTPCEYELGTMYAYCCSAILILGFILEKVYGLTLDRAFEELLCKPLGLTRSKYNIAHDEPNAVNCNHDPNVTDIRWDDNNVKLMRGIPAANGGNFITAGDLQKFVKALIAKDARLYSEEMFEISERNYTEGLPVLDEKRGQENHGLGFTYVNENCYQARDLFPDGSIGHNGWSGQSFYLYRPLGLYVIFLSNATRCTAKKYGHTDDDVVHNLRADLHKAIKLDLGL